MKSRILFLFLFFISGNTLIAQNRVGVWKSHLPYTNASQITLAGSKVYCATDGGLFYYNQLDNTIEKFSKEDGLSDTQISALGYSEGLEITVIAYANANIDLIEGNRVYNIPDIMRYTQILGDKRIYNIMIQDNLAYLSTGFGIIILNIETKEITQTCKIGEGGAQIKVNGTCFNGSNLYAVTDQGVYMADMNAPDLNLQDFHFWKRELNIPQYNKKFNAIAAMNNKVYVSYQSDIFGGDIIYFLDGSLWMVLSSFVSDNCYHLSTWKDNLVVSATYHVQIHSPDGGKFNIFINSPKCAYIDKEEVLWVADSQKGLVQRPMNEDKLYELNPNGPGTMFVSDIAISENILYTVPGGIKTDGSNQYRSAEINTFKNNNWTGQKTADYRDFYRIAIDPANPEHYYIASWGYGLFEYQKDSLTEVYREDNSTLQTVIPGDYYRLGGITYDQSGNLWVTNSTVAEPLSVLKKDGKWKSFSMNNMATSPFMGDIIVTQSGYKWMILTPGRGLFAMDDNGTIDNADDDRYLKFDVKDEFNAIITNDVYAIAEDADGNIWLGTNKGVLVYYNPSAVFDGENFYAQQIIIPRVEEPGVGDALLGTESVSAFAIDGANRKWLGTKNAGVSLVSDDGLTQIHNFTAENSPLLSNSITSIAINDKNGEVFFGTDKGIISYTADAIAASEDFKSVFVFPNPVRENFTGDVSITGLMVNSLVKITDLNGNLVFEAVSLGGQVLWNGLNFSGVKVSTGVYLVFCSNEDGSLSKVTKLLFIH
jgi:sugar lactone lactonase YvrE